MSPVELYRILAEWRVRLQRAKDILQPPTWDEQEWRQFSQALALMVRNHGRSWIIDPQVYWDLRWNLQDGGELVCQIEHTPGEKTSLVVAQNGGFAESVGSYTWLWAEFNMEGNFSRDPYWVEGTWKDALTQLLLPLDRQSGFFLAGRAETPDSLLLQEGARPNDGRALLPGISESADDYFGAGASMESQRSAVEAHRSTGSADNGAPEADAQFDSHVAIEVEPEPVSQKNGEPEAERVDTAEPFAIRWGMPIKLTWKDTDDIAYALIDAHPEQDPLKLSFPKLHKLITELEEFGDDPDKSTESILESIQMAWYEEVK